MIPRHVQITILVLLGIVLAGGLYFLSLERRAGKGAQPAPERALAAPVSGEREKVSLLLAFDDDGVVRPRETTIALPKEAAPRVREIVRALFADYRQKPSPHPIAEGSDVRDVYLLGDGTCVVDLNLAFADGHPSGILLEEMSVVTMVESISANVPAVKRVKFIVEGKDRETLAGHADLMTIYDVGQVHQMVQELE